jgi:CheY-like chemotaxis protein/two-component sensor histidine kinase
MLQGAAIMMVDDELTTLEVTELFLREQGCSRVIQTTDARRALGLLRKERPDVLLLDLIMPHIDGLEILAAVRADPVFGKLPVIILTSSEDEVMKLRALELGANEFLAKPVDPSELVLRLRNTLAARQHHLELEWLVEERTAELNLMRIRAESASRAKTDFLARMSHELRTPIAAISGYSEVLLDDARIDPEQREALLTILDLAQIESGRLQLLEAPVDLVALLRRVQREFKGLAAARRNSLTLEFALDVPTLVLSDEVRLHQALGSLVDNAIKFTQGGSVRIYVGYEPAQRLARIEVIDTGRGVHPEAIPGLFLEFEQADGGASRDFGGGGLGLAITRRLARLLGGECAMVSEPGRGTQVTLSFRAPAAPGAEALTAAGDSRLRPSHAPAAAQPAGLQGRILLVEDGADNQRLISLILRKAGAQVEIAANGRIAVERLRTDPAFDLVLMDMAMPELDGYQATRLLREMGFAKPIVALTAHGLLGERERCLAAGCDLYATKPLDRAELLRIAQNALGGRSPLCTPSARELPAAPARG